MVKTRTIFVPEEHFKAVPESFSAESKITGVDIRPNTNGIILDSLKEVEYVLRVYNAEMEVTTASSIATKMDMAMNMFESAGPLGFGLAALAGETMMKGRDFVGTMMAEAKGNIATKGRYHRSYDYDGMGSNFLKTSVTIRKVDNKFVLNISAAYVGNQAETDLAILLGRRVALSNIDIDVSMSVVDEWWYNLNLKNVIGDIGYFNSDLEPNWPQLSQFLANENHQFGMLISRDDVPLVLSLRIDYSNYRYTSEEGERESRDLTKAIGNNIAGAAWNAYRHERENATTEDRKLTVTVRFPGERYGSEPVIDPVKNDVLIAVAKEIQEKILKKVA